MKMVGSTSNDEEVGGKQLKWNLRKGDENGMMADWVQARDEDSMQGTPRWLLP